MTFDELPDTHETRAALHEAGHAAIAELLGIELVFATNRPSRGAGGWARFFPPDVDGRDLVLHFENRARACLAGPVATRRVYAEGPLSLQDRDVEIAQSCLEVAVYEELGELDDHDDEYGQDRVIKAFERAIEDAIQLVHDPAVWRAIERTAALLAEKRTIIGDDVAQIIREERCTT